MCTVDSDLNVCISEFLWVWEVLSEHVKSNEHLPDVQSRFSCHCVISWFSNIYCLRSKLWLFMVQSLQDLIQQLSGYQPFNHFCWMAFNVLKFLFYTIISVIQALSFMSSKAKTLPYQILDYFHVVNIKTFMLWFRNVVKRH